MRSVKKMRLFEDRGLFMSGRTDTGRRYQLDRRGEIITKDLNRWSGEMKSPGRVRELAMHDGFVICLLLPQSYNISKPKL
jgi:hypothetical protein